MEKQLHLVSFNIPFPADYGGVIDVFYKLKALHQAGVKIKLHCFEYGRKRATELEQYCEKIYYYPRDKNPLKNLSLQPFIVAGRNHPDLLENLAGDLRPIIFEGLHSCFFLKHPALKQHKKIVRTHNIEHEYYRFLSQSASTQKEKFFFKTESFRLKIFEKMLHHADELLCISPADHQYFRQTYGKGIFIPAFHPFSQVTTEPGIGEFILYHGNLEVAENIDAVNFLLNNVFSQVTYPFVIAGKNPSEKLVKLAKSIPHVTLHANITDASMRYLVSNAQICLLPTFQPTGLKLKLLQSLFSGRHCICNAAMVKQTGLEALCTIAETPEEIIQSIEQLYEKEIPQLMIQQRKEILETVFSNERNAQKIIELI